MSRWWSTRLYSSTIVALNVGATAEQVTEMMDAPTLDGEISTIGTKIWWVSLATDLPPNDDGGRASREFAAALTPADFASQQSLYGCH